MYARARKWEIHPVPAFISLHTTDGDRSPVSPRPHEGRWLSKPPKHALGSFIRRHFRYQGAGDPTAGSRCRGRAAGPKQPGAPGNRRRARGHPRFRPHPPAQGPARYLAPPLAALRGRLGLHRTLEVRVGVAAGAELAGFRHRCSRQPRHYHRRMSGTEPARRTVSPSVSGQPVACASVSGQPVACASASEQPIACRPGPRQPITSRFLLPTANRLPPQQLDYKTQNASQLPRGLQAPACPSGLWDSWLICALSRRGDGYGERGRDYARIKPSTLSLDASKMAALRAVLGCRGAPLPRPLPRQSRGAAGDLLQRLSRWFYDVEAMLAWTEQRRRNRLRNRNARCGYLRDTYGDNVAAAVFTLACGGGVRFEGQEHWMRPEHRWHDEVLRLRHVPVVALDLSGSTLTYDGLDNLVTLNQLQYLDLSGCPHLDDWALSRLHVFGDTLQELSVARCPCVTERGLATLHHLRKLRRLDVAGVQVASPGLVRILLEEVLPECQILGMDIKDSVGTGAGGENPPA
ncbi:distal membrane-arm assembly complex protein 2 [Cuculus canorus]|uniref:distal membrane-arm assembly complex protein 2 n=1 Tax=Cuculus canorus TaxID=55661 RepID=UPI0023AA94E2|nr:distal membrane-arm assembly complex protein 2 [Cuculus canorus]